jgi:hypothetical protein
LSTPPDAWTVIISPKEIYDQVVRVSGKIDVLIAQNEELKKDVQDHEARIRHLERNRWPLPSIAAICGVAALLVSIFKLI